jgi:hypothetical protein
MMDESTTQQELVPGIHREALYNGRLVVFKIEKMTRKVVDAWIDACDKEMQRCLEEARPLLILQDLASPNASQTPYSRERGATLQDAYPDLSGRIAYILPDTPDNQRIRLFIRRQPNTYRTRSIFFNRDEAVAWLRELID